MINIKIGNFTITNAFDLHGQTQPETYGISIEGKDEIICFVKYKSGIPYVDDFFGNTHRISEEDFDDFKTCIRLAYNIVSSVNK